VLVPDAIPEQALARYGIRPPKLIRYPGLKEEYYLADYPPDPGVADELGLDPGKVIVVLRPPPEVTLYHRGASTDLFAQVVDHLEAHSDTVQVVALPRIDAQREALRERGVLVPEVAVDGPGLIAASDLVISAGGTMNREAVALGVPAYSPFAGRLGAVDARLIEEGRLHRLEDPADIALVRREREEAPPFRDPEILVDLILGASATRRAGVYRRSNSMGGR
jgi:predicted glycosyltransferase